MSYEIIKLREHVELKEIAANCFHKQWGIPMAAYLESIEQCIENKNSIPQWYIVMDNNEIIGGAGVIENDFHDRKDLTPNICALYVNKKYRCQGIAGQLLNYVCNDMKNQSVANLYLVTVARQLIWQFKTRKMALFCHFFNLL